MLHTHVTIDASAIIAVLLGESSKEGLAKATRGKHLVAPLSTPWEVANAFSAMLKRRSLELSQAQQAMKIFHSLPIRFVEVDFSSVLSIANDLNLYAYDVALIVCAMEQGTSLLSLDLKLNSVASKMKIQLLEI